jgi:hypothetical protein
MYLDFTRQETLTLTLSLRERGSEWRRGIYGKTPERG